MFAFYGCIKYVKHIPARCYYILIFTNTRSNLFYISTLHDLHFAIVMMIERIKILEPFAHVIFLYIRGYRDEIFSLWFAAVAL